MHDEQIAFIGAGNMGTSLIGGLIENGFNAQYIWASDHNAEQTQQLSEQLNIHTTTDNLEAAQHAEVVILAVKPQLIKTVVNELKTILQQRKPLIISIAAGIHTTSILDWLEYDASIIRCMPNTPALIQCGATALFANPQVEESQKKLAESILRAVSITLWVKQESDLDTVTALSGSGPAYFFYVMESLQLAAEQ